MNIAWRVMRRDRPQMLSCMNLRITGDIAAGLGTVWTIAIGTRLSQIDPSTNRVLVQYVGHGGDALAVGHGFVWICSFVLQELWCVDAPKL